MSSISGISEGGKEQVQAAQQQQLKANTPKTANAAAASALQEANETAAQTRQEAAKGDQVAIRRLARQHKPGAASKPHPQQPTT